MGAVSYGWIWLVASFVFAKAGVEQDTFYTANRAVALPQLNILSSGITVSCISSGASFANRFAVSYSSVVSGAAIFAGKPWMCERVSNPGWIPGYPQSFCNIKPNLISNVSILEAAATAVLHGSIDDTAHMSLPCHRYYVYRGQYDPIYQEVNGTSALNATYELYLDWTSSPVFGRRKHDQIRVSPLGKIHYPRVWNAINSLPAGHGVPTLHYGVACKHTGTPYLNNCLFDGIGSALRIMYGADTIAPRNPSSVKKDALKDFDQVEFFYGINGVPTNPGLGNTGKIYVPARCSTSYGSSNPVLSAVRECRLHISFQGCGMDAASIGEVYVDHVGLLEYAEANDLVLLFPQMGGNTTPVGSNISTMQHCWDNYGITGANYSFNSGVQMAAVRHMLTRIAGV